MVGVSVAFGIEIAIRGSADFLEGRENTGAILHVVHHDAMDSWDIATGNCHPQSGMCRKMGCAHKEGPAKRQASEL
jgi:hypothetical protein